MDKIWEFLYFFFCKHIRRERLLSFVLIFLFSSYIYLLYRLSQKKIVLYNHKYLKNKINYHTLVFSIKRIILESTKKATYINDIISCYYFTVHKFHIVYSRFSQSHLYIINNATRFEQTQWIVAELNSKHEVRDSPVYISLSLNTWRDS